MKKIILSFVFAVVLAGHVHAGDLDYNDFGYWNNWDYETAQNQIHDSVIGKVSQAFEKHKLKLATGKLGGLPKIRKIRRRLINKYNDLKIDYEAALQYKEDRWEIYNNAEENREARYNQYLHASLEAVKINGEQALKEYVIRLLESEIKNLGGRVKNPFNVPENSRE